VTGEKRGKKGRPVDPKETLNCPRKGKGGERDASTVSVSSFFIAGEERRGGGRRRRASGAPRGWARGEKETCSARYLRTEEKRGEEGSRAKLGKRLQRKGGRWGQSHAELTHLRAGGRRRGLPYWGIAIRHNLRYSLS